MTPLPFPRQSQGPVTGSVGVKRQRWQQWQRQHFVLAAMAARS